MSMFLLLTHGDAARLADPDLPTPFATTPANRASRQASARFGRVALAVSAVLMLCRNSRTSATWGLLLLGCYLAAYGAPQQQLASEHSHAWSLNMEEVAALTAKLHEYWWTTPLSSAFPPALPWSLQVAWATFPAWPGGVPSSLFLATDGSGRGGGSWAFAVWAYASPRWYRIGWASAPLEGTPWLPSQHRHEAGPLASYVGELAALQAAGLWVSAQLDLWQLYMGCRPNLVTVAVDNSSALLAATGHGRASIPAATLARQAWQAVQSRASTNFQHVHSHTGLLANSLADALAEGAACRLASCHLAGSPPTLSPSELGDCFPSLWLLPYCRLEGGKPVLRVQEDPPIPSTSASDPPPDCPPALEGCATSC